MALSLDEANRVMKATIDKAKELNININVAVVDSGARLMAFNRMENAAWGGIYGAQGKAAGSAAFRMPSGKLDATRVIIQGIVSAEGNNIIPAQGAVPIFRNGVFEGACGCGRRHKRARRGVRPSRRRRTVSTRNVKEAK